MTAAKTDTLAAALVEAQKAMPAVEKTGKGNYGEHVTLDHLIAKTRQHLAAHGLSILQFPSASDTGAPMLRTILLHVSGERIEADSPLYLDNPTMQKLGGAITYARRYGWSSVLGISTEEDDDGGAVSAPEKPAAKAEKKPFVAPAIKEPTGADLDALYELVKTKGGDVAKTMTGAEAATEKGVLPKWYGDAKAFWTEKVAA